MKILLVIAAVCALLAPISATALNPNECANLLKRIHHFKTMGDRAADFGNDMWADRMQVQTDLLRERYDERCEGFAEDDRPVRKAVAEIKMVLTVAAKAAATFFTAGAF
jgi:hypothetical protein